MGLSGSEHCGPRMGWRAWWNKVQKQLGTRVREALPTARQREWGFLGLRHLPARPMWPWERGGGSV